VAVSNRVAHNGQGLPQAAESNDTSRPSRTTNIFLFNGEANSVQACGKSYVARRVFRQGGSLVILLFCL